MINVTQPYERIPLWHRAGGLTVLASQPGLRVAEQDWSTLTLDAHPHAVDRHAAHAAHAPNASHAPNAPHATWTTRRAVFERGVGGGRTELEMETTVVRGGAGGTGGQLGGGGGGTVVRLRIGAGPGGAQRAWVVRLHLPLGRCVVGSSLVHGAQPVPVAASTVHLAPLPAHAPGAPFRPFGGAGAHPPFLAGPIAEVQLGAAGHARTLELRLGHGQSCGELDLDSDVGTSSSGIL